MALSTQDFEKGLDFTGLVSASGADHNQLIDLAVPKDDTGGLGKGLIIITIDTAFDIPDVPDADVTTKWKRYMWVRRPYTTVVDRTPLVYTWDDNSLPNGSLLKWQQTQVDIAQFDAQINQALAESQAAQATADTALATANAANAAAVVALANAAAAVTTADAVSDEATNALAAANDALTNSIAAQDQSADALAVANAATATAVQALNEVQADRSLKYVLIVEQQNTGVNGGASVVGANIRQLNTEKNDAGALATVAAGIVTVEPGTYKVKAGAIGYNVAEHQLYVVKDDDDTTLIIGTTIKLTSNNINTTSEAHGLITLAVATAIRLDHYIGSVNASGQGLAGGIGPADKKEIYAYLQLEKLN
jgi:hypothetical protein